MGGIGLGLLIGGGVFLILALAGCGFCVHAGLAVRRYRSAPVSPLASPPSVVLLKPLHGAEPTLAADLRSALEQDYAGAVTLRMGVQNPADAALPTAQAVAASDPRATVVLDATEHGANRKVSNLINLSHDLDAGVVVLADSDIAVPRDYLARLTAALAEPGVGAVSCLYSGRASRGGLAARLSAMGVSYGSLPLFAVGVSVGATPCMGSTIALRRETLEAIGGFDRVKDVLADDYELGAAVRALGLKTIVPPFLVVHGCGEATLSELWRHELRWAKTTRDIDAGGYAGSVVTHPIPLALIGWALLSLSKSPWAWTGGAVALLAFAARLWLKSRVDATAGVTTGPWWLIPARDILSVAVFVGAHLARRVEWRGARFHVGRGGELTPA